MLFKKEMILYDFYYTFYYICYFLLCIGYFLFINILFFTIPGLLLLSFVSETHASYNCPMRFKHSDLHIILPVCLPIHAKA